MGSLSGYEDTKVLETKKRTSRRLTDYAQIPALLALLGSLTYLFYAIKSPLTLIPGNSTVINHSKTPSCPSASPIPAAHFHARQQLLAKTLHSLNPGSASAFIAEPGATAQYYFNVSTANWKLSERPLLFFLSPLALDNGEIVPQITVLAPQFEKTRASLLPIPLSPNAKFELLTWAEEDIPYEVASNQLGLTEGKLYVDGAVRYVVVNGLQEAFGRKKTTLSFPPVEVSDLRSQKSAEEIQIMKCANELTLEAIRIAQAKMFIGMKEREASSLISKELASAGLQNGGCLTLFGENAALPHGSGSDRSLGPEDLALFDCTAMLFGYWSDVTRTIALPSSRIPSNHLTLWNYINLAQKAAIAAVRNGTLTGQVDAAARDLLSKFGHGEFFTHRLGHGIGLEVHERPYLVAKSTDLLRPGHTFSDEPGVYIEGKIGIRLEDCFYVTEDGRAGLLTEGAGGLALSPWYP